tara:strand:+ start:365 stop:928 length:564 start_codon:yes stop_codon:yes gene_type:complete
MVLSKYHKKQAEYLKERVQKAADFKEKELLEIFKIVKPASRDDVLRIAVLGLGDKRLMLHHKRIFEKLLGMPADITTFDIIVEHLRGGENVIKHDCTKPLPNPPYDITYGHVVLKFVEKDKQWNFIKNSYDALKIGGIAIHIMNEDDGNVLPIKEWKSKLQEEKIEYKEIVLEFGELMGLALILIKK